MNIQRYKTTDGWPAVWWVQEVPSGWTWHSVAQSIVRAVGVVLGLAVLAAVWSSGTSFGWSLFWGGVVVVAFLLPDALNDVAAAFEGKPAGRRQETDLNRRWKAKHIYRKEGWRAEVWLPAGTKTLMFALLPDRPDAPSASVNVALHSFQSFEVGSREEWFGDVAQRELGHLQHKPTSWVIVAGVEGHGVVKVAESGRDKAGITNLLLILTDEFVSKRKELMRRLE